MNTNEEYKKIVNNIKRRKYNMLGRGKDFATEECIFKMVTAEKSNSCYGDNDMVIILG